jgi:D-alanyl-lipoteichoic acid acyltransferase DltB (MBOAT superfamily)
MSDAQSFLLAGLGIYLIASRFVMRALEGFTREVVMALLNLAGVFFTFYDLRRIHFFRFFLYYVIIVVVQYVVLRLFSESKTAWLRWLAFFCPIIFLIVVRYVPDWVFITVGHLFGRNLLGLPPAITIGMSYLAFRCSRLVLEVQNGSVKKPGLWQYLNFAFFLPTMPVGPINTYANFRLGFEATPWEVPVGRAALRILVGWVKYQFLGGIFNQLTYSGFLFNGHLHHWIHLPVAMVFFYLYLYCNFSGCCDMAIGAAALIGIPVPENFNNPFAARNMKELWNRWHITLSQWMRDIVFVPLSKFLVRVMGLKLADHAVALAIVATFLLVGIWHGAGWNFVAFGTAQALGVVTVHYYTIFLKKRLGRDGFKAYHANAWIQTVAVLLTFCYFAVSLIFFACTFDQIREIFRVLQP